VKSVIADMNWVPSGSMNPTILEGDLVYVDKAAYDLRVPLTLKRIAQWDDPDRGDVVIFFSPDTETRMVKRVVGTPGDTVQLKKNTLYLNGRALEYSALSEEEVVGMKAELRAHSVFAEEDLTGRKHAVMATPILNNPVQDFGPIRIPDGKFFVMGDNRDNSMDSRYYGLVERKRIVGEAKRVLASFDLDAWAKPRVGRFGQKLK